MRNFFLLFAVFFCSTLHAQVQISGQVVDAESGMGLEFATVLLLSKSDSTHPLNSTYTDSDGRFKFESLKSGAYVIKTAYLAYYNGRSPAIDSNEVGKLDLGIIRMNPKPEMLKEAVIEEFRPMVELEADKLVYNAGSDAGNQNGNAIELLRKVPFVTVEGQDEIKVNGSTSFKVLLNGRQTSLVSRNPSEALKAFPANVIKKVEVITSPGAKYDADGAEAVINIITANKLSGVNGNIGANINTKLEPGLNGSLNVRSGKFGLSAYYGINSNRGENISYNEYHRMVSGLILNKYDTSEGYGRGNWSWGELELSYDIDSLKSLSIYGSGHGGRSVQQSDSRIEYTDSLELLVRDGLDESRSQQTNPSFEYGMDYIQKFDATGSEQLTLSWNQSRSNNRSFAQNNRFYTPTPNEFYFKKSSDRNTETTISIEYNKSIGKKQDYSAGAKMIVRKIRSDLYQSLSDTFVSDFSSLISEGFRYNQYVYALFSEYQFKSKKLQFKVGLRGERTMLDGRFLQSGSSVKNDYFSLIPSMLLKFSLPKQQSLKLNYIKRIRRPWIQYLDPSVENADNLVATYGNPELLPERFQKIQLEYNKMASWGFLSINLYAERSSQGIEEFSFYNIPNDRIEISYANFGLERSFGSRLNLNLKFFKGKLGLYAGPYLHYTIITNTSDVSMRNKGFEYNGYTNLSYKFSPSMNVSIGGYYGKDIPDLQRKNKGYSGYWLNLSKTFKEVLTVNVSARNFLKRYNVWESESKSETYTSRSYYRDIERNVGIGISYRFGKLKENVSRKVGVKNDDLKAASSAN